MTATGQEIIVRNVCLIPHMQQDSTELCYRLKTITSLEESAPRSYLATQGTKRKCVISNLTKFNTQSLCLTNKLYKVTHKLHIITSPSGNKKRYLVIQLMPQNAPSFTNQQL